METLTIEDIDLYSQVSRRAMKEDLYSIVDSSFMPCGIECDQYSIIGEITGIETKENRVSGELVYDLTISCATWYSMWELPRKTSWASQKQAAGSRGKSGCREPQNLQRQ